MILVGQGRDLSCPFLCIKAILARKILDLFVTLLNLLYSPRSIASKEKGQSPPIVTLSSFINGISNDRKDPCKPRMSHLEHRSY